MILLPEKYIIIAMKEIFITTYPVYAAYGCKAVSVIAAVIFYGGHGRRRQLYLTCVG